VSKAPEPRGSTPGPTDEGVKIETQSVRFARVCELCGTPPSKIEVMKIKMPYIDLNKPEEVVNFLVEYHEPRDRISTILNTWSTLEGVVIPPQLAKQLGIRVHPQPLQHPQYPPYDLYGYPRVQPPQPQSNIVDIAEALKILKSDSENSETTQILLQRINALERSLEAEREAKMREKEKQEFEKRLQETEKRYSELLEKVTEKFETIIESLRPQQTPGDYKSDEFRLVAQSVDRLANTLEKSRIGERLLALTERVILESPVSEEQRQKDKEILSVPSPGTSKGIVDTLEQIDQEYVE